MDSEPKEELDIYERRGETLGDISSMLRRLAESGNCSQEYPGGAFSSSSNDLATWVSCLADRIDAAAKREEIKVNNAFRESAKADEEAREDLLDRFKFERAKYDARIKALEDVLIKPCLLCTRIAPIVIQDAPCSAAALREALENVERVARFCAETPRYTLGYPTDAARSDVLYSRIAELGRVARAALAGRPRNCDLYKDCDAAWKAYNALDKRERLPGFDYWLFEEAKQEGGAK